MEINVFLPYFQFLYLEESKREATLNDRARTFVSINSIMIGLNAFKASDISQLSSLLPETSFVVGAAILATLVFIMSFFTCLSALGLRSYENLNVPRKLLSRIKDNNWDEVSFFVDCISDCVVTTDRNSKLNDSRARWLRIATLLMFAGFGVEFMLLVFVGNSLRNR